MLLELDQPILICASRMEICNEDAIFGAEERGVLATASTSLASMQTQDDGVGHIDRTQAYREGLISGTFVERIIDIALKMNGAAPFKPRSSRLLDARSPYAHVMHEIRPGAREGKEALGLADIIPLEKRIGIAETSK
jgi:hypothetical protein